jgi:fucose permease
MTEQSIFQKQIHPYYQVGVAIILNILGILLLVAIKPESAVDEDAVVFWELSFSILLAFMLFNSVLSLPYVNRMKYFSTSIFSFLALAFIGGALAHFISGVSMDNAGSFRWLYIVFTFTYLVFLSIVNLMRKIMEIAKREDSRLRGEQ